MDQFEAFIGASARLTGFGRVDLLGGNVAESYLATVSAAAGADLVGKLCATVLDTAEGDLAATMMADDEIGPIAQRIALLWYTGTWHAFSDAWHASYGQPGVIDETRCVSAESFLAGLQWKVVGAHPPGAAMQGFGAWSLPPAGDAQ